MRKASRYDWRKNSSKWLVGDTGRSFLSRPFSFWDVRLRWPPRRLPPLSWWLPHMVGGWMLHCWQAGTIILIETLMIATDCQPLWCGQPICFADCPRKLPGSRTVSRSHPYAAPYYICAWPPTTPSILSCHCNPRKILSYAFKKQNYIMVLYKMYNNLHHKSPIPNSIQLSLLWVYRRGKLSSNAIEHIVFKPAKYIEWHS